MTATFTDVPQSTVDGPLSATDIEQFWRDGYVLVKGAVSRDEAEHYRQVILGLVPRDLSLPSQWSSWMGRLKPHGPDGDQTIDIPELIPLFGNEKMYAVAAQLFGTHALRAIDGSVGITLKNDSDKDTTRSQTLHIDASVPSDADSFLFTPEEVQIGGCFYFTDVEPNGGGIHVVPGGHRIVEDEARAAPDGRHLHNNWKKIEHLESIEVTGGAGDFAMLHHLMPHGASHNRNATARVAHFLRWVRVDHAHGDGRREPRAYNQAQLAAMTPLTRRLLGLEPW
ncbi:MAG: phytanoyl-CoA dioxygenase family protein [Mycobacteriales bacterium]